jgi:hypothetical protein
MAFVYERPKQDAECFQQVDMLAYSEGHDPKFNSH